MTTFGSFDNWGTSALIGGAVALGLGLGLLTLLARRYIAFRLFMSGDPGDDRPIGELPDIQRMVTVCTGILHDYGFSLESHHMVLDFGCGTGRHTYEFRDQGFCAFGFDMKNYVKLRAEGDIRFFMFPESGDPPVIPSPDNRFDFLFSMSVLEHTLDYDSAFREMRRVLKPGGVGLHVFPSRLRPIEPHMYVPFGGCFQSYPYFLFWAAMGVRSEIQAGRSWKEVARMNLDYARRRVNYLSKRQILQFAHRHFRSAMFGEGSFIKHTRQASKVSRVVYPAIQTFPFLTQLYRTFHTRVLFFQKQVAASGLESEGKEIESRREAECAYSPDTNDHAPAQSGRSNMRHVLES